MCFTKMIIVHHLPSMGVSSYKTVAFNRWLPLPKFVFPLFKTDLKVVSILII